MTVIQAAKTLSSLKIKEKALIFSFLAFLTIFFPTFFHSQPITGSLVNMSLILAVFLIGLPGAVLLGIMPSIFALAFGLLPLALAPMVPFIIAGNVILIIVYRHLGKKNFGFAVITAAFCKFLFLYASVTLLLNFLPDKSQLLPLASMMGWAQFLTAFSGGILAFLVLFFLKKTEKNI